MTVFLTTHYMEEADGSDRVVIIDEGKIAANDTPLRLKQRYSSALSYVFTQKTRGKQLQCCRLGGTAASRARSPAA